MSGEATIRPSWWFYVLAVLVLLGGGGLSAVLLISGLIGMSKDLTQVLAPGKTVLTLKEAGDYTIFLERESVMDGRAYSTVGDVSGLRCTLVNKDSGAEVELSRPAGSESYTMGGRSGVSAFSFELSQPGAYELSAEYPDGQSGPQVVLAIGHAFVRRLLTTIIEVFGIGGGSIALALIIGVWTFVARLRARAALQTGAA